MARAVAAESSLDDREFLPCMTLASLLCLSRYSVDFAEDVAGGCDC